MVSQMLPQQVMLIGSCIWRKSLQAEQQTNTKQKRIHRRSFSPISPVSAFEVKPACARSSDCCFSILCVCCVCATCVFWVGLNSWTKNQKKQLNTPKAVFSQKGLLWWDSVLQFHNDFVLTITGILPVMQTWYMLLQLWLQTLTTLNCKKKKTQ